MSYLPTSHHPSPYFSEKIHVGIRCWTTFGDSLVYFVYLSIKNGKYSDSFAKLYMVRNFIIGYLLFRVKLVVNIHKVIEALLDSKLDAYLIQR